MPKKRILIFSLSYLPLIGGAEIAVKEITDRLPEFEFDLVTAHLDHRHLRSERIGNVNVYRIGWSWLGYINKIIFILLAVRFALFKRYDAYWAIMTYMLMPIALLRLVGRRIPYALTLQDGDPFNKVFGRWFILPFRPLIKYGLRRASRIQAISQFLAKWAEDLGYQKEVQVIPNGVDIKKFDSQKTKPADGTTILITVSRLVEKNGVLDILEALRFLPDNVILQIVGSGPLESILKHRSRILNLGSRVKFFGEVPHHDVPQYLRSADIFVRPSLSEGQGVAFLEAMAAGLPVIATPVGGILDFLKDEETGLFCEVGNPESIAREVNKLMNNESLRTKLINNGKRIVREQYDWAKIVLLMRQKVFNFL